MVRAIDTQHVILQSSVVEKIQQTQQQNPDMQQRNFALDLSEQDSVMKETIKQTENMDFIKEHEEHESGRKNKEQRHMKETPVTDEESVFEGEGENINIKV